MPKKDLGELTAREKKLLIYASKFDASLRELAERPPPAERLPHWEAKMIEDLVHL